MIFPLFALNYDFSLGHRNSVVFNTIIYPEISLENDRIKSSIRVLENRQLDFLFIYKIINGLFNLNTGLSNQIVDFNSISASIFFTAEYCYKIKFFSLKIGAGMQLSILKTKYLQNHMFALTPILLAVLEININKFTAQLYVNSHSFNDLSWRTYPVYGTVVQYDINNAVSIYTDVYVRAAEYLVDNWRMINSLGVRLGLKINS